MDSSEPAATDIKRMISFEVLDQSKTAKKSNKTKNPNVQKIANHQPLSGVVLALLLLLMRKSNFGAYSGKTGTDKYV